MKLCPKVLGQAVADAVNNLLGHVKILEDENDILREALKQMVKDFEGCYADAEPALINARKALQQKGLTQ